MSRLLARTVAADPWLGKIGLAIIATGTAIFFALPLPTFATFPASYRLMASVLSEGQWAALYGAVALLTWLALWMEGDGPKAAILADGLFCFVHGPLWFFTAYSAISGTPAAYFPWWSMAAVALAEWIVLAPLAGCWWARRRA